MIELMNCVSGDAKFIELWKQICDEQYACDMEWINDLRNAGFKAAHPNDGWVNRESNEVHFAYPQFNDGADIGDLVMLGWSFDKKSWCPVSLINERISAFGIRWWKYAEIH